MKFTAPPPTGAYTMFDIDEKTGLWLPLFDAFNQIQMDWAIVAVQCLGKGRSNFRIGAMYIEYENVADPSDIVSVPSYSRREGREYYENLTGDRDYLRVPLLSEPRLSVATGTEDDFSGEGDDFNEMTFIAQSTGITGMHGTAFSDSVNSKACGIALVAAPVWADRTRDIVFGRAYYATNRQITKELSHQIGVSWRQTFG